MKKSLQKNLKSLIEKSNNGSSQNNIDVDRESWILIKQANIPSRRR